MSIQLNERGLIQEVMESIRPGDGMYTQSASLFSFWHLLDNINCLLFEVRVNVFSDAEHVLFFPVWYIFMMYYNKVLHCSHAFRVSASSFHALLCMSYLTSSFLFYLCLPTGHCLTPNAVKGKLLPSLCTIVPIILTHSL